MTVVARGIPLPFGAVDNRRSLIGVENLADAVACLLTEPAGRCETFLVSDGDDVSTPELIRQIAASMQRPARLFAVPPQWLRLAGALTGQAAAIDRLCGSLVVDCSAIQARLGWRPPHSLDQGLADTVAWFKQR